jgi:hypothetical protein
MLIVLKTETQTAATHTDLSTNDCYLSCLQNVCRVKARWSNSLRIPSKRVSGLVVVAQYCGRSGHMSNEGCRPYASCAKQIRKAKDSESGKLMHAENG